MGGDSDARDLIAEFLEQEISPEPEVERKNKFYPWHKPRKQYVRREQWCHELKKLLDGLHLNGRPISYLGLPGDDMLDIREFHDICQEFGSKLRYLGFNDVVGRGSQRRSRESLLSHSELRSQRYSNIDWSLSELLLDPLESLNTTGRGFSVARQRARTLAPYDVVNFDLCGSIGKTEPGDVTSVVQALAEVLEIQRELRGEPWLLLLTTRTEREQVQDDVWNLLQGKLVENAESSSEFLERLKGCVNVTTGDISRVLEHGDFGRIFTVGFCKWLIGRSTTGEPSWEPTLASVLAYRVHRELDMYSLAFRMERRITRGHDPIGWTKNDPLGDMVARSEQHKEEIVLALHAVSEISNLIDVDDLLQKNTELRAQVVARAEEMMRAARYDADEYRRWVDNGCK